MSLETENFDSLRRLLALKRHEIPPPGYFNRFSRDVIARIEAGESGDAENGFGWLRRLWEAFETRPIFVGAFGAAVCGLIITAAISPQENPSSLPPSMNMAVTAPGNGPFAGTQAAAQLPTATVAENPAPTRLQMVSSTNAVAPSLNSLFDLKVQTQPASFSLPGGN